MAGLDDLAALFGGGTPTPSAPAPAQTAQPADPTGLGNVLAILRSAQQGNGQGAYGGAQGYVNGSLGKGLADVRGMDKGSALAAGISQGIQARAAAAQAAQANQLALMKLQWDHELETKKFQLDQQKALVDAAYKKSLGNESDARALKTKAEAASPASKDKAANAKTLHDVASDIQNKTGYDPGAGWFQKLPQQEQDARRDMFTSNYKLMTGADYPTNKDGTPVAPPSLMQRSDPLSAARKSPFADPNAPAQSGGFLGGLGTLFGGKPAAPAPDAAPQPSIKTGTVDKKTGAFTDTTPAGNDTPITTTVPNPVQNSPAPAAPPAFFKDENGNLFKAGPDGNPVPVTGSDIPGQPTAPPGSVPPPPGMTPTDPTGE